MAKEAINYPHIKKSSNLSAKFQSYPIIAL